MLKCPNCSSNLEPSTESGLLSCQECNVFLPAPEDPEATEAKRRRKVELPSRFQLSESGKQLELRWPVLTGSIWILLFATLFWNGAIAIPLSKEPGWGYILFLSPFILVGVWMLYTCLATLVNSTVLRVEYGMVRIYQTPLPRLGTSYRKDEIEQLYCRGFQSGHVAGRPIFNYNVMVLLKNGRRRPLITFLENVEEAAYIEQKIESHLGIEDRVVSGELQ